MNRGVESGEASSTDGTDHRRPLVLQDDVQGVDDTRQVPENGQQDVDEQVGTAATLQEDTQRREDDSKNDLADVAGGERHVGGCLTVVEVRC